MKELDDVYPLAGMITHDEVDCLYQLGQFNDCKGTIVEIGSWKGKSTIALARGAARTHKEKIYAIDPHSILREEGYLEDTQAEFLANIQRAGVEAQVIPMIMSSEEAARGWDKSVRLLWIDGDHRYESTRRDFVLWEPHLAVGGILIVPVGRDPTAQVVERIVKSESGLQRDTLMPVRFVPLVTGALPVLGQG